MGVRLRPELELLERDQAIAQLLAAAGQDESSVALITGEAGIGKTSVVRALLDRIPPGTSPPPWWTPYSPASAA